MSFVSLKFWGLSLFQFLSFSHNLFVWAWSQFEFSTIWVFSQYEFCHYLSFWVLSQLELSSHNLGLFTTKFLRCHLLSCHFLGFWVVTFRFLGLSQIEFLSFVKKKWVSQLTFFCVLKNVVQHVFFTKTFFSPQISFFTIYFHSLFNFFTQQVFFSRKLLGNKKSILPKNFHIFSSQKKILYKKKWLTKKLFFHKLLLLFY